MNDKPLFKRIKNTLIYFGVRLLILKIKILPRKGALLFGRILARAGYALAYGERAKIHRNLTLAYGEKLSAAERDTIGRAVFRNAAQNLVDAILMPRLLTANPSETIHITGLEIARQAFERGKGVIFLTAHTGCFEMLPPFFSLEGFPLTVIGARIYDDRLNRLIAGNRKSFGVTYLERGEDLRTLISTLKSGGCFGVLCDLDTRVESLFVNFFGTPAKTVVGPFKLGIKYGAALIPVFGARTKDHLQQVRVLPEIFPEGKGPDARIKNAMETYNRLLEDFIRQDPTQWIWMHDRWKSKP